MASAAKKVRPSNSNNKVSGPFLKKDGQQSPGPYQPKPFVQPKLNISQPGDIHEQEADAVADSAVKENSPAIQPSFFKGEDGGKHGFLSLKYIQRSFFSDPAPETDAKNAPPVQMKPSGDVSSIPSIGNIQASNTPSPVINPLQSAENENKIQQKEGEVTATPQTNHEKQFENKLNTSKGNGSPLPGSVQSHMESNIGADFSSVRVHTGNDAAQMSQSIGAQAFTHGNDIYFNEGKYNPGTSSGKHLIAHELTHTVQQGASVQRKSNISSAGKNTIQRSWLGDAWDAVSGAVSDAVEWAADQLDAAKDWLLEQLRDLVVEIPGYKLFTVVIGRDPITDQVVPRNGLNFIEAGLDLIPFGDQIKAKLEENGALGEAAAWLDGQIELLNISPSAMMEQFRQWFRGLSITDVGRPREVLRDLINIFAGPIGRIINFIGNLVAKFLEILKRLALTVLVDFVKEQTTAYPLLTVILGEDPITHEAVERNGMNILRGFILLHPEGEEQLRQMEETGSLQRAADWVDHAIATVTHSVQGIINAFSQAWDLITIENMLHPIETFRQIYNLFAGPVGELMSFLWEVAKMILKFIKDALLSRISAWARETRGYPLVTVLLGKDPFTEEVVPRTAENIIRGFMALLDGGLEKFNQLQETGAIQRMVTWIEGAVADLNITWAYIKGLFISLWESMSLSDLANPLAAFGRIIATFAEPVRRILAFIWEVIKALVRFGLEVMNFPFQTIQNIVNNAMQAFEDIKRDPIQFFLNLLAAVKKGFSQFFDNILTHLLNGLRDWLFGELGAAGIHPPADLSFRSILGLVLEVLGITMDNIWARLALKIGAERVAQIRSAIDTLTGIWNFVRDVQERGPIAIWEYIQEQMSNLWDMILGYIRNWIMTRIIERVTARLLSMLDPTGIMAVVNGFIAFYRAVQSFMEKLYEMLQIVDSFVAGVANIARGDISQAANFLENALARAIPVAIGFLANQVGLRGLGARIGEMIEAARERVNGAIDWLIDRAMSIGGAILNSIMGSSGATEQGEPQMNANGTPADITEPVTVGGANHTLKAHTTPEGILQIQMASDGFDEIDSRLTNIRNIYVNNIFPNRNMTALAGQLDGKLQQITQRKGQIISNANAQKPTREQMMNPQAWQSYNQIRSDGLRELKGLLDEIGTEFVFGGGATVAVNDPVYVVSENSGMLVDQIGVLFPEGNIGIYVRAPENPSLRIGLFYEDFGSTWQTPVVPPHVPYHISGSDRIVVIDSVHYNSGTGASGNPPGLGSPWIERGHLIGQSLGGPGGVGSGNIVAMTYAANHNSSSGMRAIEYPVEQDIKNKGAVYRYRVRPNYNTSVQIPPISITINAERLYPSTSTAGLTPSVSSPFTVTNT